MLCGCHINWISHPLMVVAPQKDNAPGHIRNGLRNMTWCPSHRPGLQFPRSLSNWTSPGHTRTSLIHGLPTLQSTGLKGSATNASIPASTPSEVLFIYVNSSEPSPIHVCLPSIGCPGTSNGCSIDFGSGEFGEQVNTLSSLSLVMRWLMSSPHLSEMWPIGLLVLHWYEKKTSSHSRGLDQQKVLFLTLTKDISICHDLHLAPVFIANVGHYDLY